MPTHVKVSLFVNSFGSVREQTMDYEVNIFFRQSWLDLRLNYDLYYDLERIAVHHTNTKQVWKPDPFFINEKQALMHIVPEPNKFLHIHKSGNIQYSVRLTLKLSCSMNLKKFPMDVQICSMKMQSCK